MKKMISSYALALRINKEIANQIDQLIYRVLPAPRVPLILGKLLLHRILSLLLKGWLLVEAK